MIILEGFLVPCDILSHGNLIPYFLRLDFRKNRIADYRLYMSPGQLRLCSWNYNQIQLKRRIIDLTFFQIPLDIWVKFWGHPHPHGGPQCQQGQGLII